MLLLISILAVMVPARPHAADTPSLRLHAFYYPWYGTPEHDGEYVHWRHDVMGDGTQQTYPGGDSIGADFYPVGGCYSSSDPAVLHRHMRQLRDAGIGVVCVSWLGPDCLEARALDALMDVAAAHGIQVDFHLEPAVQESIETIRDAIVHLIATYGEHPAFYRDPTAGERGLFYVYDSRNTPASEWARLLTPGGDLTIRGTRWDAAVLGLLLTEDDLDFIETAGNVNVGVSKPPDPPFSAGGHCYLALLRELERIDWADYSADATLRARISRAAVSSALTGLQYLNLRKEFREEHNHEEEISFGISVHSGAFGARCFFSDFCSSCSGESDLTFVDSSWNH